MTSAPLVFSILVRLLKETKKNYFIFICCVFFCFVLFFVLRDSSHIPPVIQYTPTHADPLNKLIQYPRAPLNIS